MIKYEEVAYRWYFPAYCIGDAKLLVSDLQERAAIILDLQESQMKHIKFVYKGLLLDKPDVPLCEYGAKHGSELLMVIEEPARPSDTGSNAEIHEALAVANLEGPETDEPWGELTENSRKNSPVFLGRHGREGESGRWDSNSEDGGAEDSPDDSPTDRRKKRRRPSGTRIPTLESATLATSGDAAAAAPLNDAPVGRPGGPIEKLNALADEFNSTWVARCNEFIDRPPRDKKQRGDEHRRLSENILQQILLPIDSIDVSTEEGGRARRRQIVKDIQGQLNRIDTVVKSSR